MWALLLCLFAAGRVGIHWRRSGLTLGDFLGLGVVQVYARLIHGFCCNGPAPLPRSGPAIVVANHTCSADAAFLTVGCAPRILSFLIAEEYYAIPQLGRLVRYIGCVPVRRDGCDVAAARAGLRRLSEGRVLCIFPEGGLSNAGRGRPRIWRSGRCLAGLAQSSAGGAGAGDRRPANVEHPAGMVAAFTGSRDLWPAGGPLGVLWSAH